jgi:taurine--2-oxoglutarate transaminase
VGPDLITFAKGVNFRLRPARRRDHLARDVATFAERVYPRPDVLRAPARQRGRCGDDAGDAGREIVENADRIGREVHGRRWRTWRTGHPSVGEARGLGVFWALELVKDKATKEPLAPYGRDEPGDGRVTAACKERGLMPFVNYNRTHVVPPCTVSDAEAKEGLAILDEALAVADEHAAG